MRTVRSMLSATLTSGVLLALTATSARADGRTLFVWSGTVDREAIIVMRGANLETRGDGYDNFRDARFRVMDPLPHENGVISIARADGRGDIEVIEQPTVFNGYTARVRVRDRQSGADRYRLEVKWDEVRGSDRRDRRDDDRDYRDGRDTRGGYDRGGYDRGGRGDVNAAFSRGGLRWSGDVDAVAEIRIQGRRVDYYARNGRRLYDVRSDLRGGGLPEASVPLDLRRFAGRGNVFIAQYPRVFNNWTAIIRIDDSRGGSDLYDFELRW